MRLLRMALGLCLLVLVVWPEFGTAKERKSPCGGRALHHQSKRSQGASSSVRATPTAIPIPKTVRAYVAIVYRRARRTTVEEPRHAGRVRRPGTPYAVPRRPTPTPTATADAHHPGSGRSETVCDNQSECDDRLRSAMADGSACRSTAFQRQRTSHTGLLVALGLLGDDCGRSRSGVDADEAKITYGGGESAANRLW